MQTDLYTKIVLTVIAAALVGNLLRGVVGPTVAERGLQKVVICDLSGNCAGVSKNGY
jgi:hypothetical protein